MSDQSTAPQITGAFELFSKSKERVMKYFKFFAVLYAVPFLFTLLETGLAFAPRSSDSAQDSYPNLENFTGSEFNSGKVIAVVLVVALVVIVIALIIGSLYQVALHRLELDASENKTPTAGRLWEAAKKFWLRFIGLSVLVGLYTISGLLVFLPIVLLSAILRESAISIILGIPAFIFGIYVAVIMIRRYFLAPYVLVDQGVGIREAMERSDTMTKGRAGSVWGIIGVFLLIYLISIVPLVGSLISFILGTLYSVAPALRYQELKHLAQATKPTTV